MSTPAETPRVLAEIAAERTAQDAKWGRQDHPDHVPNQGRAGVLAFEHVATQWKNRNKHREDRGDTAFDGILLEEVFEACAETDPAKLRAELIQVAAVAVCWIEAIDRRTKCSCTTDCPEDRDENTCPVCRLLDPYDPCPVIGFGCGDGCDCCAPEQQRAADGALVGPVSSSEDTPARVWQEGDTIPAHVAVVYGKRDSHFRQEAPQGRGPDGWWNPSTGVISEQRLLAEHGPVSVVPAGGEPA